MIYSTTLDFVNDRVVLRLTDEDGPTITYDNAAGTVTRHDLPPEVGVNVPEELLLDLSHMEINKAMKWPKPPKARRQALRRKLFRFQRPDGLLSARVDRGFEIDDPDRD